jgi:choline-sulfatase
MSLYDTELHVPLLIIPPGRHATWPSVKDAVSLRDLTATIVEIAGQSAGAPLFGQTLTRFWETASPIAPIPPSSGPQVLGELVPNDPKSRDTWGAPRQLPALGAVKEREWSYIRREGDPREKLFHLSEDPKEERNLAGDPSVRGVLDRMRAALDHLSGGPLLSRRFNP